MSITIISKNYSHYNRTLGKYISSKRDYYDTLKQRGFVPFEKGCQLAEAKQKEKQYTPSADCVEMMSFVMSKGDENKNINLTKYPKVIDGMKQMGCKFELPNWLPNCYKQGGFSNEK